MPHSPPLCGYQLDNRPESALTFVVQVQASESEIPFHHHRKGQLILALHGSITCEVPQALWLVPPQSAVWIPAGLSHSIRATADSRLCLLFVASGAALMPESCCTLSISPLLRELILALADRHWREDASPQTQRLIHVLLDELVQQPVEHFQLPVSEHPKIRQMIHFMAENPATRRTLRQWAPLLAMSERNLARLIVKETGLSYRRWRQQLQLIQAVQLLLSGANVQETARALGYESATAFITVFKQRMGQTPGHYLQSLT